MSLSGCIMFYNIKMTFFTNELAFFNNRAFLWPKICVYQKNILILRRFSAVKIVN